MVLCPLILRVNLLELGQHRVDHVNGITLLIHALGVTHPASHAQRQVTPAAAVLQVQTHRVQQTLR